MNRSEMMANIKNKNTKPEILLRKELHHLGLRYRLHVAYLPGHPDLAFPVHRVVIFIHGCFWHGHDCPAFRYPKTNTEFWKKKIEGNRYRDRKKSGELLGSGWRVLVVWECTIRAYKSQKILGELASEIRKWILTTDIEYHER